MNESAAKFLFSWSGVKSHIEFELWRKRRVARKNFTRLYDVSAITRVMNTKKKREKEKIKKEKKRNKKKKKGRANNRGRNCWRVSGTMDKLHCFRANTVN